MKLCLEDDTLHAYFDGELAPQASTEVSAHLAECVACSGRARQLEQAVELIGCALDQEFPEEIPTERLYARVRAAINGASALVLPIESITPFMPGLGIRIFEGLMRPFRRYGFTNVMAGFITVILALSIGVWRLTLPKANGSEPIAGQMANSTDSAQTSLAKAPDQPGDGTAARKQANPGEGEHVVGVTERADTTRLVGVNHGNRSNFARERGFASGVKLKESQLPSRQPEEKRVVASTGAASSNEGAEYLDIETAKHIEKAQSLFHSIMNLHSPKGKIALDFTFKKQLSRELLNHNNLLSRRALTQGNWQAEEMLSRLEPFLLDIANLPDRPSLDAVRLIKELVREKEGDSLL